MVCAGDIYVHLHVASAEDIRYGSMPRVKVFRTGREPIWPDY